VTPRRAMEVLLETPGEVFVHAFPGGGIEGVDPKYFDGPRDETGALLPDGLRVVSLKFSPKYDSRLVLDADGVRQVLSFEHVSRPVFVPWAAVFGMHKAEGVRVAWAVDAPAVKPKARLSLVSA